VPRKRKPGRPKGSKRDKLIKESVKAEFEGFRGGLPVDLDKKMSSGNTLREDLSGHIKELLDTELKNQSARIEKIGRGEKQYKGEKEPKNWPFPNCANTHSQLTRSNVDNIFVRIADGLFNKVKVWVMKARKPEFVDIDREVEEGLNWLQKHMLKFKQSVLSPLLQCLKTGTGIVFIEWVEKPDTQYVYASESEIADKTVKTYPTASGRMLKKVSSMYKGPKIHPVSRKDFVISSDAKTIQDAYLVGFRKYMRKPELELRTKKIDVFTRKPIWDKKEADKIKLPDDWDEEEKERAEREGKELEKPERIAPYEIWQLWTKYDVDEDGEEDDIIVTFHKETGAMPRVIFNPTFYGFRPFVALKFYPTEYSFDGEGICDILFNLQEQIDTLNNQLIDRLHQINAPILFARAGSGITPDALAPGKVRFTDGEPEQDLWEFRFSDQTYSVHPEIERLTAMADRVCGITPEVMGMPTAERPVARETFARIQEANKKFKYGIDNLRDCINEIGMMLLDFFAQYQPVYTYTKKQGGTFVEKTMNFPQMYLRDGIDIDLATSTEMLNQEVRREINTQLFQLLMTYYQQIAPMWQAIVNPTTPPDFKKYCMALIGVGNTLLDRIIKDFNQPDSEQLLINVEEIVNPQQVLMSPMMPPMMGGMQGPPGQGQSPQGGPGMPPIQPMQPMQPPPGYIPQGVPR